MGWHGYQLVITEWSLVALSLFLVSIRLYVQITAKRPHKPWKELLLVFAFFTQVAHAVVYTILLKLGQFEIWTVYDLWSISTVYIDPWWTRLYIFGMFTYPFGTWALRCLLLLIYLELAPRHLYPRLFWLIVFGSVLCAVCGIGISFIWGLMQCFPYSMTDALWNMTKPCPGNMQWVWGMVSSAIICDLVIYLTPIIIISRGKSLTWVEKLGSAAMFTFGFINIGTLVTGLIAMRHWNNYGYVPTVTQNGVVQFAQILQVPTAIVIVCTPSLRVLGRWKVASRVADSFPSARRPSRPLEHMSRTWSMRSVGVPDISTRSSSANNSIRKPAEYEREGV